MGASDLSDSAQPPFHDAVVPGPDTTGFPIWAGLSSFRLSPTATVAFRRVHLVFTHPHSPFQSALTLLMGNGPPYDEPVRRSMCQDLPLLTV